MKFIAVLLKGGKRGAPREPSAVPRGVERGYAETGVAAAGAAAAGAFFFPVGQSRMPPTMRVVGARMATGQNHGLEVSALNPDSFPVSAGFETAAPPEDEDREDEDEDEDDFDDEDEEGLV
jgi:hypothetical protein